MSELAEIYLEHGGARLFAVERGRGDAVIFMHGGLADHRAALVRLAGISSTHRLITPDARGAGRSHWGGELSWELLADDVAAWIDHLGLERAWVGGISAGSAIALAFARRHPSRARGVLLVAPVYPGADRGLPEPVRTAMKLMGEAGARGIEGIVPLFEALPEAIRERAVAMARSFDPASVAATTRFLATEAQPFARVEELAEVTLPVLVVPGTDPQHPAEVADVYARAFPRCTVGDSGADLVGVVRDSLDRWGDGR